jgi:hypothetical protein
MALKLAAESDNGGYMPDPEEFADLDALENGGIVDLAYLFHPVVVTWCITDDGGNRLMN